MKTKTNHTLATLLAAATALGLAASPPLFAQEKDDHEHEHAEAKAGPNGGRVIHSVEPHLEFFVTEDRKVQITAVDDDHKPVAIGSIEVAVTAGDRANPTRMKFEKKGDVLVSDIPFPAGNGFPVVVQIKTTPDAKPVYERFNLDLSDCPTCKFKEYACICDHEHEGEEKEAKEAGK